MRGFIAGALALIALQVVLSTPLAGLTAAIALPAKWAQQWMDPAVPLITATAPAAGAPQPAGQQPAREGTGPPLNTSLPPPPAAGNVLDHAR